MKRVLSILCLSVLSGGYVEAHAHQLQPGPFLATAFAQKGITRSGIPAQPGLVAADTRILPLGTTIQVRNAGPYSGTYTVADTGSLVRGRHIDIFMPSLRRAREFGKKIVEVTVLRWGQGYVAPS